MDIYASVYNAKGVEVYKIAIRAQETAINSLKFKSTGYDLDVWGTEENIYADQKYTVKVYAQISTGERPVLWEGGFTLN
jgi:hypothetical protein